jgi:hypothetical protein
MLFECGRQICAGPPELPFETTEMRLFSGDVFPLTFLLLLGRYFITRKTTNGRTNDEEFIFCRPIHHRGGRIAIG